MRLLFLGDVVGRPGRDAVVAHLPGLRQRLDLDFVVVNGENAASGFGITEKICRQLFEAGADVITGGNHSWDQRDVMSFIGGEPRLLRPQNFPVGTPGRGNGVYETRRGKKVLVMNVMGQLFMEDLDDAFACIAGMLSKYRLGATVDAAILDFHAEATSEKMAAGHYVDGKVSLFVGTHTHVPTADTMILAGGTAYQSDAGMCGDYDSVIGMDKEEPLRRFTTRMRSGRFEPATGAATLCGIFVETDDATGLARRCEPIRVGGQLSEYIPA